MKLKTDTLAVKVYARHGDCCGLEDQYGHHDALGCASGYKADDYVLSAQFAYLQEAIDYAQILAARGVNSRLVSRICKTPYISDYPKKEVTVAA